MSAVARGSHPAYTPPQGEGPMRGLIWAAAVAALLAAAPANAVQIYTFYLHVLGKIAVGGAGGRD